MPAPAPVPPSPSRVKPPSTPSRVKPPPPPPKGSRATHSSERSDPLDPTSPLIRLRCIRIKSDGHRCGARRARGSKLCKRHFEEAAGIIHARAPGATGRAGVSRRLKAEVKALDEALAEVASSELAEPSAEASAEASAPSGSAEHTTKPPPKPGRLTRTDRPPLAHGADRMNLRNPTNFVVNEQARDALAKLGLPDNRFDPKAALLDSVRSAWRQRLLWESLLASIPADDFTYLGVTPLPGVHGNSTKGARIEAIQHQLTEATKLAVRSSKLAIDAGIEERLVRLAEEQSAMIADTVRAALAASLTRLLEALGLTQVSAEVRQRALEAALHGAADHLKLLAAGQAAAEQAGSAPTGPGQRMSPLTNRIVDEIKNVTPKDDGHD